MGAIFTPATEALVQQILTIAGMVLVSFGWVSSDEWNGFVKTGSAAIGPVMAFAGALWAFYSNRKSAIVTKVASMPEVRTIVTEPTVDGVTLANSNQTPSNVVVAHPVGSPVPPPPPHP